MKFKLVSWNVRGLNNREKRRLVNSMVWGWKVDIICLQETKFEGNVSKMAKQIWGRRWVRHVYLKAGGTRGGEVYY